MSEITVLKIEYSFGKTTDYIYPVVLQHEEELVLVDCGYPNFLPQVKEAAKVQNIDLDKLTKVVVTHHDYDHMGALAQIKRQYPNIKVLASKEQAPFIQGEKKSLRLQQAESLYDNLPDSEKPMAKYLHNLFASVEHAQVDEYVTDGQMFPWCGGAEIIHTPGHMPGHSSLYFKKHKTLISGDALAVQDGILMIANPNYCLDLKLAKQSVQKLLGYDIEKIICYHGGVFEDNVKTSLEKIIQQ